MKGRKMLQIKVWDVSHGSAAHILTPNGRHIAVDLGADGADFSPLQSLQTIGVGRLDVAVITHPHRDHLDDISNFHLVAPPTLYWPKHLLEADVRTGNRAQDAQVMNQYFAVGRGYSFPVAPGNDLCAPDNYGGASFKVYSPKQCPTSNLNNHSLVVVVAYAGLKMVIPGDNEAPSWNELLGNQDFVTAIKGTDIFLAPHHGRDSGFCAELFQVMGKPRLIVVSDGRFGDTSATNRYVKQARGWDYFNGAGEKIENCKCLTTRKNGHITVKFGWHDPSNPATGNYLEVRTSKPDVWSALAGMLGR
jgi:competence protein ComEC